MLLPLNTICLEIREQFHHGNPSSFSAKTKEKKEKCCRFPHMSYFYLQVITIFSGGLTYKTSSRHHTYHTHSSQYVYIDSLRSIYCSYCFYEPT